MIFPDDDRTSWVGHSYHPPRWMRKEAYYKAKHLHALRYRKLMVRVMKSSNGRVGFIEGIRFVESVNT